MSILTVLIPVISSLIEKIFPDKAKQSQAKKEILQVMYAAQAEEFKAKGAVLQAEIQGKSWMQRNWRPSLMFLFIVLIANNYILVPYLLSFGFSVVSLPLPDGMWNLLSIGIGGYIVGRSGEKMYASKFNENKYFSTLKELYGTISNKDLNKHKDMLRKAQND